MKNKLISYLPSVLLLAVLMGLFGLYSVWLGIDVNFDLLNYHLYNPYAWLNGKIGQDVFAAGVHSCLNPLPDLYLYGLYVLFFNSPQWIGFFMGLPYGLLVWLIYQLSRDVFRHTLYPKTYAFLAALVGGTAAGLVSQIGTSTNEIPLTCVNVAALWLLLRAFRNPASGWKVYAAAFVTGCAVGCKLTVAPFCLALTAALVCNLKAFAKPWKIFAGYAVCGVLGFLLTDGYFLWKNFVLYGNPIFPFYNQIFQSPYFDAMYLTETRFFPQGWLQWVFYPFYWAFAPGTYVSEIPLQDGRMALLLLGLVAWGVCAYKNRLGGVNRREAAALVLYGGVGYVLWLTQFSILRYAATLEALCGLIAVGVCASLGRKRWGVYAALLLLALCSRGYHAPEWHHEMFWDQAIFFDQKPQVEDDSLVFFMPLGTSYLAPLLNPKATYMGGVKANPQEYPPQYRDVAAQLNNISPQFYRFHLEGLQRQKIAAHQGPIYIVTLDWPMKLNPPTLARFGLRGSLENCQRFVTNFTIYSRDLAICRVEKIPA